MNFDDLLVKPKIEPFDSNTQRIRRNLLAASILGVVFTSGSASFNGSVSGLLGIKLEGLNITHLYYLLLASLVYFFIHFLWASLDDLKGNYLRLTGIRVPMATVASYAASSTFEPNVSNNGDSTLFSWWKAQRQYSEHLQKVIENIDSNVKESKYELALNSAKQNIEQLNEKVSYIEASLLKFEQGYWKYQRSQILRWYILDFGVPNILAITSIVFLIRELLVCT
ncbi:hypothetical protein [Vibrio splendidus]|uniref:hypothetical protein n=1 Tax=Vibrio splendidus TaxID=29497 RepID=UPI000D38ABF8|nr:hypothetical protein [Vibrio splendidus]PTO62173.1 hypothetical protein CWN81_24020 [Vibrio splendidus]